MLGALLSALLITAAPAGVPATLPAAGHYQAAGTPEVGGVRHLALIYHGNSKRVPWTAEALMPYVAHVDEQGRPTGWLFDSFLFLEFATNNGAWIHHYREGAPQARAGEWCWLAQCWFRKDTGLIGLERAVAQAGQALREPDHKVNVIITLPVPLTQIGQFGRVHGRNQTLDFSREEHRIIALTWYIEEVLARWQTQAAQLRHLRLVGFYWTDETVRPADHELVEATARLIHAKGLKFYWIPYFSAQGHAEWRRRGFDACMLQPNYFFIKGAADPSRLAEAARRARSADSGVEIEFDGRALSDDEHYRRFYDYLNAGIEHGWREQALLGYYEGGGALKKFAETPGRGRELYEALCRFVQGTYRPFPAATTRAAG